MSGLASFFGLSGDSSYETSLIETTGQPTGTDVTHDTDDGTAGAVTVESVQASSQDYRLCLKQKMLAYMRYRIFGDEVHPDVPHIDKAISSAKDIAELNLHVKVLNVSLCRVEKIWPLRSCKRGQNIVTLRQYLQFDGPINTLYRSVLSFEILQCFEKPPSELSVRIRNLHGNHHSNRCRVFMYGNYATKIAKFFASLKEHDQVFCSLRHVPARCIFRYKRIDWVDAKERYCLGIGDDSAVERAGGRERFDSEDMIMELLRVDAANKVLSEYQIRRLDDGTIALEKTSESRLMSIFKAYLAKNDSMADDDGNSRENRDGQNEQSPGDEPGPERGDRPGELVRLVRDLAEKMHLTKSNVA
jgi:hypothetical protein